MIRHRDGHRGPGIAWEASGIVSAGPAMRRCRSRPRSDRLSSPNMSDTPTEPVEPEPHEPNEPDTIETVTTTETTEVTETTDPV